MPGRLIRFIRFRPVSLTLLLITAVYLVNGVFYLRAQSLTYDETAFIDYAARLVHGHPEKIKPQSDHSKLPVVVINLIPRVVNQLFHPGLKKTDNGKSDVFAGRYMTLLVSVFTILLVFYWSKSLYGEWAGLFSAFLISFCPNMLANAGLVTTDSYSILFLTITIYFLWKFCRAPSYSNLIWFSVCMGLSQLIKQSLFHLYVLAPLILIIYYLNNPFPFRWRKAITYALVFIFINWLIINTGFYFRDSNILIGEYQFYSRPFLSLQQVMPGWIPIPFPKPFVTGLDLGKYYDEIGGGNILSNSHGKITILGNASTGSGFWYYYLISILFKTPISSLIFIAAALAVIIRRSTLHSFIQNEFFLLAPVVYYLVYMSFFYNDQIGIRHISFIYPLLYILCGQLLLLKKNVYGYYLLAGLCIFLMISSLGYWRNYYPYTNELITDKKMAYRYVGCANLQLMQSRNFYEQYLLQHPEVKFAPTTPATGVFLIELDDYMDIWNLHQYDWISHIKPSGQVACNGLLITVTEQDLKKN